MVGYTFWIEKNGNNSSEYVDMRLTDTPSQIYSPQFQLVTDKWKIRVYFVTPFLIRDEYLTRIHKVLGCLENISKEKEVYNNNKAIKALFELGTILLDEIFDDIKNGDEQSFRINTKFLGRLEND